MKTLAAAGSVFLLLLSGTPVFAGGLSTPGQGARALGMASAFTAVADDGSAIYYNPAGISQSDGTLVEASLAAISPQLRYTTPGGATETSTRKALAPAFFMTRRLTDRLSAGLGVYAPFARDAELQDDLVNGFAWQRAKMVRTDLSAVVSWQANEAFFIGGGLVAGFSQIARSIPAGPGVRIADKIDGTGVGGIVGLLWKAGDRFKAGVTYRSGISIDHDGQRTLTIAGVATTSNARAEVRYPASFGLGIALDPSENLTLALDVDWTGWRSMDQVTTRTDSWPDSTTQLSGRNSRDVRIGGEYRLPAGWSLRAGVAHIQGAFPATHITPSQPDGDGHETALGVGRKLGNWRFDFAYQNTVAREQNGTGNIFGYNGKQNIRQHVLGLTAGYRL